MRIYSFPAIHLSCACFCHLWRDRDKWHGQSRAMALLLGKSFVTKRFVFLWVSADEPVIGKPPKNGVTYPLSKAFCAKG